MSLTLKTLDNYNSKVAVYYKLPFKKDFIFNTHYHPRIEIMYVESGSITFRIPQKLGDKHVFKLETLKDNQYIILDSNTAHGFVCNEDIVMYSIEISEIPPAQRNSTEFFNYQNLFYECPAFITAIAKNGYAVYSDKHYLYKTISQLISLLRDNPDYSFNTREEYYLYKNYYQQLMIILCLNASVSKSGGMNYISKANAYIRENFSKDISVSDIADSVGINKYYLQKLYKQHTKNTLQNVVTSFRLEMAKDLLLNPSLSIEAVAKKVGFNIRQQLIYNFKKYYGVTPSQYIEQQQHHFYDKLPDAVTSKETYDYMIDDEKISYALEIDPHNGKRQRRTPQ